MKTKTLAPMLTLTLILAIGPVRAATLSFEGSFELVGVGIISPGEYPSVINTRPVVLPGTGVATINGSVGGTGGAVTALAIPGQAFLGTGSVVNYNAAPLSGIDAE